MNDWIAANGVTVIGWIGGLAVFGFYFGRRFQSLEDADRSLAVSVKVLAKTVETLSESVNGQNGNGVLARALENLSTALRDKGATVDSLQERVADHAIRLAKLDAVVTQLDMLACQLREQNTLLTRIDERVSAQRKT